MSALESPAVHAGRRRSTKVALVLLGTAGVVGIATALDAWRKASRDDEPAVPSEPPVPIDTQRQYANNEYLPGVGYYHAPYHAWYPYPYNYHDPSRGYFAGGLWQALPWMLALNRSQPNPSAVTSALAARQKYEDQQRQQGATSQFSGTGGSGGRGWFSSSRPSSSPASRPSPPIIRGGFGSSSHPAGS